MMVLRFLLHMINPYKNGRLQKKNSFPHRLLLGIYNSSMRALMHFYKQYAFVDVVQVDCYEVRQSHRDIEFEKWLSQMKVDLGQHLHQAKDMPKLIEKKWWRPFYKFFHFEHVMSISYEKGEINLSRTPNLTIMTQMKGQFKLSDCRDVVQRSEFKVVSSSKERNNPDIMVSSATREKKKVSLGDTSPIVVTINEPETKVVTPAVIRQLQGAEIDESF